MYLVISNGGYDGAAVIGDNVAAMARNQGLAAIVTDGLVRDIGGSFGSRDSSILLWGFSQFSLCAWTRERRIADRYFSIGNSTGRYDCWRSQTG